MEDKGYGNPSCLGPHTLDVPVNFIFEDQKNPDLLFVGNDTGLFVSINGGKRWVKMKNNIPNVPVHDLLVHPRENDLILGS